MKVRINTNKNLKNKYNYYNKLGNLLDKLDYNNEKLKNSANSDDADNKEEIIFRKLNENQNEKKLEICKICNQIQHKYICPKCKVKYCSVKCFKEHNIDCTENFYKKCVEDELKRTKIDEKDKKEFKRNIQNIFTKQSQEDELYDQEKISYMYANKVYHLEGILNKINNNTLDFARDLTKEDWDEFTKFINGFSNHDIISRMNENEINKINILKIWKPFWESKLENAFEPNLNTYDINLISILDEESKNILKELELNEFIEYQENEKNEIYDIKSENFIFKEIKDTADEINAGVENFNDFFNPNNEVNIVKHDKEEIKLIKLNNKKVKIDRNIIYKSIILKYENIPKMNTISKITPSDKNPLTLIDVILNMTYLFRLYNGELTDLENNMDIIAFIIQNLKILYEKNIVYDNALEVVNKFKLYLSSYEHKNYKSIFDITYKDLEGILKNKFYVFESLYRIYEIIHKFLSEFKKDINKYNDDKNDLNCKKYDKLTKNLNLAKHKILYFLSYVKSLDNEKLIDLLRELKVAKNQSNEINIQGRKIQNFIKRNKLTNEN